MVWCRQADLLKPYDDLAEAELETGKLEKNVTV